MVIHSSSRMQICVVQQCLQELLRYFYINLSIALPLATDLQHVTKRFLGVCNSCNLLHLTEEKMGLQSNNGGQQTVITLEL